MQGFFDGGFVISDFGFVMPRMTRLSFRSLVSACLLLVVVCLAGCAREMTNQQVESMRTVTDDLGRLIRLPQRVSRAISLAPSITESIFAAGAGDRLVGVTTYCNYPAETASIEKIGDTLNPNIEKIVALKPDIVFVSTASQLEAFTKTLEGQGVSVFVSNPKSLHDVLQSILGFGDLFGTRTNAEEEVRKLDGRRQLATHIASFIEPRSERTPLTQVFIQISKEPLFTIGKDSFLTDVLKLAYGESVTKDVPTAYPMLSKETALALNPDVIILSDSEDNQAPNDVFKNSPAVKNGRVYKINADIISRPGPRLVDAIEQIAVFLHGNDSNKLKTEN
jgi:iron complex transport system substrate-binding protein